MKILVIGKNGQLASEFCAADFYDDNNSAQSLDITCLGSQEIDLFDLKALTNRLSEEKYNVVINTAAYTAVDMAESDLDAAEKLNIKAIENLATCCSQLELYLIHISTDFVFDGNKSTPYKPEDETNPLSIYGKSKLAGENKLVEIHGSNSAIIRTSWVYSIFGKNFVKSMLHLMANKDQLGVVSDQIGTPTYAKGLAQVILTVVKHKLVGIFHWSDAGVASWYDFAVAIQELALEKTLLTHKIPINPIKTEEYPTPAIRPCYSLMDKSKVLDNLNDLEIVHWRTQLGVMLDALKKAMNR